jgi:hypothetical protein
MAYVPPNSTIQLLANIPVNPDYENTLYFQTRAGQDTYMQDHVIQTFTAQSYQRKDKGTLRLEAAYGSVYNTNYMRFKNTSFENKWFYAFVTKVEYINNSTVELTYQIDLMQTWMVLLDYEHEQCYVEREHAANDAWFQNLVPENLDLGDGYIQEDVENFLLNDITEDAFFACVVGTTPNGGIPEGHRYGDIYIPYYARGDDINTIMAVVNSYTDANNIIGIYLYPSKMGRFLYGYGEQVAIHDFSTEWHLHYNLTQVDGYHPYNNKLFQYPYKLLTVSNNNGSVVEYHWEDWAHGKTWVGAAGLQDILGNFDVVGCPLPNATVKIYPTEYGGRGADYDNSVVINNFPQCAWVSDTFKAWWAQNKASMMTGILTTAVAGAGGIGMAAAVAPAAIAPAVMGATLSVGNSIASSVAKVQDMKSSPAQVGGQAFTENINVMNNKYCFTGRHLSIRRDAAERIDRYFQMYGYACHQVKKPYVFQRQKWWYTKTIGCDITGNLPADDKKEICEIYDKGIRFWWDKVNIGVYDTANILKTPDA